MLAALSVTHPFADPAQIMHRAIELARQGEGFVEPNPMVGAVLVDDQQRLIAEGWHRQFGGPHAEIEALRQAGEHARGATLYVTLEPCCHFGKTPPCSRAVIGAGVRRVIVGLGDPHPKVAGGGIQELINAGIEVEVGLLAEEINQLNAPFLKLVTRGRPFVIAKWAMTLDGKIASRTGESQWISNERSRAVVHQLRGRVDAILVGAETARRDDPLLTPRPAGPRTPLRIVVDTQARLSVDSQLVRTVEQAPVLVLCGEHAPAENQQRLRAHGVEVCPLPPDDPHSAHPDRPGIAQILDHLGRRQVTNLLVEGGAEMFGALLDAREIDEVHAFLNPRLLGGAQAPSPIGGTGFAHPREMPRLIQPTVNLLDHDIHIHGRIDWS